jgi:cephalosporin hydroxylase
MKDPLTLSIYQQLFNDILPGTIIEFGAYEGGSALWMNDICKSLGLTTKIITFDIDKNNYKCPDNEIEFHHLDCNNIENFFNSNRQAWLNLKKPIVVIEDCHVNVKGICLEIDKILSKDDYLIIEDTLDFQKHTEMLSFLKQNNNYTVERKYCDMWGFNNTWNVNSFLRKL